MKRGEGFAGDVNTSFKNKNVTADVKVDTKSNVSLTIRGKNGSSRDTGRGRKGSSRGPLTSYSLCARYPLRYSSRSRSRSHSPLRSRKASVCQNGAMLLCRPPLVSGTSSPLQHGLAADSFVCIPHFQWERGGEVSGHSVLSCSMYLVELV